MVGGTIMSNKMWTSTQSTQSNPRYVRPFTELIL